MNNEANEIQSSATWCDCDAATATFNHKCNVDGKFPSNTQCNPKYNKHWGKYHCNCKGLSNPKYLSCIDKFDITTIQLQV